MPFERHSYFFYLYLKQHIETEHDFDCGRADEKYLTIPFPDKISEELKSADVVIVDCTGRNPNVFYELGVAHALDKEVILITQDSRSDSPSDIRHYDILKYDLGSRGEFFQQLDQALRSIFVERYEALYAIAMELFIEFRSMSTATATPMPKRDFMRELRVIEATTGLPSPEDPFATARLLLPLIVANSKEVEIMGMIADWISSAQT